MADTPVFEWFPARILQEKPREPAEPHALVVLNQPLSLEPAQLLWQTARFRIAADGGANQLYNVLHGADISFRDLDVIIGDLDSLSVETRKYFETVVDGHATEVIQDPDQYSTDFTKAVRLVRSRHPGIDVVALGGLGGRVDQGISQLHHLYLFDERGDGQQLPAETNGTAPAAGVRTFLLTSDSLAFLLLPGRHRIHVREKHRESGAPTEDVFAKHVGILPMQGPSVISTQGFEWDVEDWPTEFGGQMSTSNHILPDSQVVEVVTNRSVIFSMTLKEEWQDI